MTKLQKISCVVLSVCFFAVLAVLPGPFFLRGNVYRQFPLYCFLEERARSVPWREDPETYERLMEKNAEYLAEQMEAENRDMHSTEPGLTGTPEAAKTPSGAPKVTVEPSSTPELTEVPSQASGATAVPSRIPQATAVPSAVPQVTAAPSLVPQVTAAPVLAQTLPAPVIDLAPEALADYDYLLNHFYIVDSDTATSADQLNAERFLSEDLTVNKEAGLPQILIYHSHTQEAFADSREGEIGDTIVGVGDYLTKILRETYGYEVIHVTEEFDLAGGQLDRNAAYDYARSHIEQVLEKNPSIEVVIDLHRDGVAEDRRLVTDINGKPTAQIMFYNGLSYTRSNGPVEYLPNPYIQENLAFSFQMEYQSAQYYPDFYRGIYLSALRYNLHLRERSVLLEAGAQTNTVQEVKNAMEPFADILDRVLTGR